MRCFVTSITLCKFFPQVYFEKVAFQQLPHKNLRGTDLQITGRIGKIIFLFLHKIYVVDTH